ncbi:FAD-dependent oxidoreductase [Jannaschia donghaensis]|uniref:FAD-dependent oxidoreductase n=1 Tax=Jannaschia donghaensis TaxID=420998 RepID=UPI001187730A|nr:FAD-dependent oxidoreductase [Jannaschia donghaensis]
MYSLRCRPLVDWVRRCHPEVSTRDVRPLAGPRPMIPEMLPWVMRGKQKPLLYNTGHGHLGWTLASATAALVADLAVA